GITRREAGRNGLGGRTTGVTGSLGEALQDRGHALAAADAHRLEAEGLVVELEPVDEGGGDAGAGHAERVPDGDGAAVHVELVAERVEPDLPRARDDPRGERLVDLHQVDVVDGHAPLLEGLLRGP